MMKNIVKFLFIFLLSTGFISCSNEVGYPDPGPAGNPENEIAGTYTGVWTRELNGDVVEAQGAITFTPTDKAYVTNVAVSCPDFNIDMQGIANVVNNTSGYIFANQEAKENGFGTVFEGRILKSGEVTIKFTLTQRENRKQYLYNYNFSSSK